MNIAAAIQMFKSLAKAAFANRNDPKKWEGWIDVHEEDDETRSIKLNGMFKEVKVELSGLRFVVTIEGKDVVIEGKPGLANLEWHIDGDYDPDAKVKFAPKGTVSHPFRTAVDIRPLTFEGDECRFNLRFNG